MWFCGEKNNPKPLKSGGKDSDAASTVLTSCSTWEEFLNFPIVKGTWFCPPHRLIRVKWGTLVMVPNKANCMLQRREWNGSKGRDGEMQPERTFYSEDEWNPGGQIRSFSLLPPPLPLKCFVSSRQLQILFWFSFFPPRPNSLSVTCTFLLRPFL